jgi:hypothetical protein
VRFNVFSGARRIAVLTAAVGALITLGVAATHEPYVPFTYVVEHPTGPFKRSDESCPSSAARHYFTKSLESGKRVSITLCILSMKFGSDGKELIPYRVDEKGMLWGAATYSSEVSEYERQLERRFRMPFSDQDEFLSTTEKRYWDNWKSSILALGIGFAVFWLFVWATGWIVRGFLGIPMGSDGVEKKIDPGQ